MCENHRKSLKIIRINDSNWCEHIAYDERCVFHEGQTPRPERESQKGTSPAGGIK